jgi:putative ABC transport system permease protein
MAALASLLGYLGSLFLNRLFTANIMLYLGTAPKSMLQYLVPIIAVGLIFLIVISYCTLILRRFNKITAVEALRSGNMGETQVNKGLLPLHKSNLFNVNVFLGIRDVTQRFKMYRLLFFVFFVCTFIIIIPINLLNTIQSPSFITYMGIGRSDIRIDLRHSDDVAERFNEMITYIQNDKDVERFSPLVTSQFKVINSEGVQENISVETGDFTVFPLEYLNGAAPTKANEIALSYLNSQELNKPVGDTLRLVVDGREQQMVISGTYQDVTNGGRTAKVNHSCCYCNRHFCIHSDYIIVLKDADCQGLLSNRDHEEHWRIFTRCSHTVCDPGVGGPQYRDHRWNHYFQHLWPEFGQCVNVANGCLRN